MHGRRGALVTFLLRRVLAAAVVVFIVASATFLLSAAAQGDYFDIIMGFNPTGSGHRLRAARGLDRPVAVLYAEWLAGAARLDFGTSLMFQRPVGPLVADRAANTAIARARSAHADRVHRDPGGRAHGQPRRRLRRPRFARSPACACRCRR